MKKIKIILAVCLAICFTISCSTVFASNIDNTGNGVLLQTRAVKLDADSQKTYTLSIKSMGGKKVYGFENITDPNDRVKAFNYLNQMMQTAETQAKTVNVTSINTTFYGNDTGYSNNNNCVAYTWADYIAGGVDKGGSDQTWGGSSALLSGSQTLNYMYLKQKITFSIVNTNISVNIGYQTANATISQTNTQSSCSWTSPQLTANPSGAEHEHLYIDKNDLSNGNIISCLYVDGAEMYINGVSTIYKPSTYLKFSAAIP